MEEIVIHDQHQCEIKYSYKIKSGKKTKTRYNIETYFFFPESIDINEHNYTKSDFYKNLKSHIRLKTPFYPLKNIASGSFFIYKKLENLAFKKKLNRANFNKLELLLKMFACIVKSAWREHEALIISNTASDRLNGLISSFINYTERILKTGRKLCAGLLQTSRKPRTNSILCAFDEYISYLAETSACKILDTMKSSNTEYFKKFKKDLMAIAAAEFTYRKKQKYAISAQKNSNNAGYLLRAGYLKKYTSSILFLNTDIKYNAAAAEQLLFGLSAGVAMAFATAVAFLGQQKFGNLSFALFLLLTISYILKDRLKDLIKIFISSRINKIFSDFKARVYTDLGKKAGWCKLGVNFVPASKIPPEIKKIYTCCLPAGAMQFENTSTLLFRKKTEFYPSQIGKSSKDFSIDGIIDIMRLNIDSFLAKMDNPKKKIYIFEDDDYRLVSAAKQYVISIIIKYIHNKTRYRAYQMILSRKGIVKISRMPVHPAV
ncbi:MAG: hypothetical protein A2096_10675 [Spirochaetes bacterium GWF1_41_5]|nr:MAG: hypothetical protein A2096_10675 [Spirochaetes bacterium GWF1_41_5]HBE02022.1 hypothetical protein [Spirochaetia bacterium]